MELRVFPENLSLIGPEIDFLKSNKFWKKITECTVHKIGRLQKFNRTRETEFTFLNASNISMKLNTLVHHVPGYKTLPQIFQFLLKDLVMVFQSRKKKKTR